jgi:hypothetical protein
MGDFEFKGMFDVAWKKDINGNEDRAAFDQEQYRYKTI